MYCTHSACQACTRAVGDRAKMGLASYSLAFMSTDKNPGLRFILAFIRNSQGLLKDKLSLYIKRPQRDFIKPLQTFECIWHDLSVIVLNSNIAWLNICFWNLPAVVNAFLELSWLGFALLGCVALALLAVGCCGALWPSKGHIGRRGRGSSPIRPPACACI